MASSRGVRRFRHWWYLCLCFVFTPVEASQRVTPTLPAHPNHVSQGSASKVGTQLRVQAPLTGQYIPHSGGGGRKMHIPVEASRYYSMPRMGTLIKDGLRGMGPQMVIGVGISGLLLGVDWIMQDGVAFKEEPSYYDEPSFSLWQSDSGSQYSGPDPHALCESEVARIGANPWGNPVPVFAGFGTLSSDNRVLCTARFPDGTVIDNYQGLTRQRDCPPDYTLQPGTYRCMAPIGVPVPVGVSDLAAVDSFIQAADAIMVQNLLKDACLGSTNPSGCLQDLQDKTQLSGPASVSEPATTVTSTTVGPDGIARQQTSTTQVTHNIRYGDNYYDHSTRRTTTINNPDGSTETIVEDNESETPLEDTPQEEYAASPCSDNCDGPAYQDLYTPTDETKEQHIDSYMNRVQSIPLIAAVGSFFDVSVSASCPTWTAQIEMPMFNSSFNWTANFDYHCQSFFTDYQPFCAAVFILIGGFLAFRIGML
jgi:hypothetical protein